MTIHLHVVPTELASVKSHGEPRWCFSCRKHRSFHLEIHQPTDPMSYYGPSATVRCEFGHADGDLFPGRWREWTEA